MPDQNNGELVYDWMDGEVKPCWLLTITFEEDPTGLDTTINDLTGDIDFNIDNIPNDYIIEYRVTFTIDFELFTQMEANFILGGFVWDDSEADYLTKKFYVKGSKEVFFKYPKSYDTPDINNQMIIVSKADYDARGDDDEAFLSILDDIDIKDSFDNKICSRSTSTPNTRSLECTYNVEGNPSIEDRSMIGEYYYVHKVVVSGVPVAYEGWPLEVLDNCYAGALSLHSLEIISIDN